MTLVAVPKPQGRVLNPEFVTFARTLPCILRGVYYRTKRGLVLTTTCEGRTEANHSGDRPKGRKADDDTCLPMCHAHHQDWTDYTGFFDLGRMSLDERHAWRDDQVAIVRKAFAENRDASESGGVPL